MTKQKQIDELKKRVEKLEQEVDRLRFAPMFPIDIRIIPMPPNGPSDWPPAPQPYVYPWVPYAPTRTNEFEIICDTNSAGTPDELKNVLIHGLL